MMEWDKRTKDHPNAINKNLSKREDDWWVESGGPPVTNNGKITTNTVVTFSFIQFLILDLDYCDCEFSLILENFHIK